MSSASAPLRKSPSGPKAIGSGVDVYSTAITLPDLSTFLAGTYILFNEGVISTPVDPASSQGAEALVFNGVEARAGKVGNCRIANILPSTSVGSDPYKLQWLVDGLPASPEVTVPWAPLGTFTGAGGPTAADVQALLKESFPLPDDFTCSWVEGQNVTLQIKIGTLVFAAGDGAIWVFAFEKNY